MSDHLGSIPLTQSQMMIWTGQSLAGDAPLYNMAWRFDLHLDLNKEIFAQAFCKVFGAYDALNVRFETQATTVRQLKGTSPPTFPASLDFSAEKNPDQAAQEWCEKRARRPIDLSKSTYDTCLIKLADSRWIWFLNQHHIATDAWSGSLIFKAVSETYEAMATGNTPQQGLLPSFSDYATNAQIIPKEVETYWASKTDQIDPMPPVYGGQREASQSASTRIRIAFGADRTAAIKSLARTDPFKSLSSDLSIFALLMTGFAAYLSRITGQNNLNIGTPSHNRATATLKETPGLFIEMFPLDLEISQEASFEDLFKTTLTETLAFLRHAKPGASTAQTATAFNAVLNYIPIAYGSFAGAPGKTQWLHPNAHDPRHDIRLHVYDFNETGVFSVEMDLNDAVCKEINPEHISDHFLAIFDGLLSNPKNAIANIPLIATESEEAKAAVRSGPEVSPRHQTIIEAINLQHPDAIACSQGTETFTYADLSNRADQFAGALIQKGVRLGDPVLIHAERSFNLVAAILGCLKAGGYFIPVPKDAPSGRVAQIIELAKPVCAISDANLTIDTIEIDKAYQPAEKSPEIAPDHPAYTIFTSGSTGIPKGVQVDHKNLLEYIRWAGQEFGETGPKTYPLYSSIGFDLTLTSIFTPLTTGGQIVIYPDANTPTDLSILDVFRDDQVDLVKLTPAHLALLCEENETPRRIKTLILGGENLSTDICNRALQKLSANLTILNEYGPTEAVVGCMIHRFNPSRDTGASVPIGDPADNTAIKILDEGLNPVPIGVTGEIHIGGKLAMGYLNRPDLTSERFITHKGQRLYRTGDLARIGPNGQIQYLGRADAQLKIGGVRIEPAEVEAAFLSFPGLGAVHIATHLKAQAKLRDTKTNCSRCGISSTFPETEIGPDGICDICKGFDSYKERAGAYFKTEQDLSEIVASLPSKKTGKYDAIVLLSGGKDSTYALYRFAELTGNILALTLDNGFISDGAKRNIRKVTDELGIDHRFMTTPAMNAIFKESLTKHSNVCQGCFKTIYTLALDTARKEGIPAVVTGLSRGQFFETRLTPELFKTRTPSADDLDQIVADARKSYHAMEDAVSDNLNITIDQTLLDEIEIIDIYRYIDVPVSELYSYLGAKGAWTRPDDTGRSTNCLINDVGIYVHKKRKGFHNYALPYSWDVRMGHKTRLEAMDELDDEIDTSHVNGILTQIGFDQTLLTETGQTRLVAYVTGTDINENALRAHLATRLLPAMIPSHIIQLDQLPLTSNGKIDTRNLPAPDPQKTDRSAQHEAPKTEIEAKLAAIYSDIIGQENLGVTENFYDMGGDSIAAIQIAILASDRGLQMNPNAVFEHQTIRSLARHLEQDEDTDKPQTFETTVTQDAPLIDLNDGDLAAITSQLSGLNK